MPYARRRTQYRKRFRRRMGSSRFRARRIRGRSFRRGRRTGGKLGWYNRRYNFKDSFDTLADYPLSTSGGGFGGTGLTLKFASLPTYAVRSNMGDQFKIYKWKLVIIPLIPAKLDAAEWRAVPLGLTSMDVTLSQGQHALSIDYTDSAPVTNWGQVRTANNACSIKSIGKPLKAIIRPRVLKSAYETGIDSGYMPGTSWISMSDASVPHYGFKYHWEIPGYDTGATVPPNHYRFRTIHTVYYGIKNVQRSY